MRPELVIFVGLQGWGKTTYYHEHFAATHVHVSKDLMPNARNREMRQQQQIEEALGGGRSVVVDNTNPSIESRAGLAPITSNLAQLSPSTTSSRRISNSARSSKARVAASS